MSDVFINYRTHDEESAAALIERDLSARFGEEKIFRDNRSIEAGIEFQQRILGAVHGSRALLAVIGPRWAGVRGADGGRLLDREADWVRRELVEAREYDVRIIPVLVGDAPRLDQVELPTALSWLQNLQFRRFSTGDAESNLDRIAGDLTDFVPGLRPRTPEDGTTGGSTVHGNQTIISGNHGPVHGGIGDQYNGPTNHFPGRERRP